VVGVPVLLLAVLKIPQWQVGTNPLKVEEKARIDAETAARIVLIQGVGGLLLFTTAGISWLNLKATQRNILLAEEKQVTERFSKAVEMLGNESSTHIRLGGIYALERIAKDSVKDHWQVMEILTAFVREKTRLQDNREPFKITDPYEDFSKSQEEFYEELDNQDEDYDELIRTPTEGYVHPIAVEIQAILTALGRRTRTHENGEQHILDLSRTDLRGVLLTGNLVGINLEEADLRWAILKDVDLSRSKLAKANLEVVRTERANLQEANLQNTQLQWAEFFGTNFQASNLENANLCEAKFQGGDLTQVNLKSARLHKAELAKSTLRQANLIGAGLDEANLSQANLENANLEFASLEKANLQSANLEAANLEDACLKGANLDSADLHGANLKDTDLRTATLNQANFNQTNLCATRLTGVDLSAVLNLTPDQVKSARHWKKAIYSPEFRQELGLPAAATVKEVLKQ
jgi:uncharacterized protein YjbI with pentapeptide repeats